MDLFECNGCSRRYVGATGSPGAERPCRVCGGKLALVARSIPGSRSHIAAALGADRLDPEPEDEAPPISGGGD